MKAPAMPGRGFRLPRSSGEITGAEGGIRTPDLLLGKEMLYQTEPLPLTDIGLGPLRCAEGQNRTDDTSIFSAVLYQLSYLGAPLILGYGYWGVKVTRAPLAAQLSPRKALC